MLPLKATGMLSSGSHRAVYYFRRHKKFLSYTSKLCHSGAREAPCSPPLEEVVEMRRQQAQRSLLVEVASAASAGDLCQVCGRHGTIEALYHYTVPARGSATRKEMILVEFSEASGVEEALRDSIHPPSRNCPPSHSPQVWLSAMGGKASHRKAPPPTIPLTTTPPLTEGELDLRLAQCSSISEQVQSLHDGQKLTDLGWRLRFFTCRQVEAALSGLFPQAAVLPFGSSVNSFGHRDSDLDMTLELGGHSSSHTGGSSRLMFQGISSSASANPRLTLQRRMEVVAEMLDHFIPGCSQVRRILNARVPIIKYRQDLTGIECDLTMANRSGYHMSRMLHLYGSADPRVAPLVGALRCWARSRGITSPHAGRWLTNFSLTLMVLTYLMNTSPPILLPLTDLGVTPGVDEETGDPVFVVPPGSAATAAAAAAQNTQSLEALLRGFFAFCDRFRFRERGLSIVTGRDIVKPAHCALYIQNPLECDLNVSRNVTLEEVERLNMEVMHARYLMEAEEQGGDGMGTQMTWGAQRLWMKSGTPTQRPSGGASTIDWQAMFLPTEESPMEAGKAKTAVKGGTAAAARKGTVTQGSQRGMEELPSLVSKLKQKALLKRSQAPRQTRKGKVLR